MRDAEFVGFAVEVEVWTISHQHHLCVHSHHHHYPHHPRHHQHDWLLVVHTNHFHLQKECGELKLIQK
jgi:hypothetical protein